MRAKALVFVLDQNALSEAVAETRQRALNAADIDQVGAGAEDHARVLRSSAVSSRARCLPADENGVRHDAWPI